MANGLTGQKSVSGKMASVLDLITIFDYIEDYRKCKICGADNTITIVKHKVYNKGAFQTKGMKYLASIEDNIIRIREEGPYKVFLAEETIDINTNAYSINAIDNYIYDTASIDLTLSCGPNIHEDYEDYEDKQMVAKGSKYAPSLLDLEDEADDPYHYYADFVIDIDQEAKTITNIHISNETLDNGDYTITKNHSNNKTVINRKQKSVRLPFVYDKDFKDFDFGKIQTIASLLK